MTHNRASEPLVTCQEERSQNRPQSVKTTILAGGATVQPAQTQPGLTTVLSLVGDVRLIRIRVLEDSTCVRMLLAMLSARCIQ